MSNEKIERPGQLQEVPLEQELDDYCRELLRIHKEFPDARTLLLTAIYTVFIKRGMLSDIGIEQMKGYK